MKTFLTSLKGKLIVGLSTLGVVGAVVAAAIIINSGYRTIVVDGSNGSTEIVNGSNVNEAYVGLHLKSGDDVTVKNTSDLTLALDQDKYVYAEENTHFWIEAKGKADDTRTVINLDEGCNLIRIDQKLKESESFEVDTPNTTVSVRGTVYRVTCRREANGDTYTIIEVFEGEVYVAVKMENGLDTGENRYLQAGESAIVRSNSSISEFVKNDEDGTPVHPIYYSTIPKNTAKQIGRIIDSGRKLCISKELLFDVVELIEHDFTKEGERVEPTCTEPGYVTTVCSICGLESEREILPVIEHDYEYIDYPETEDHPAYREKKCKICEELFETIEDPEKEHKYGDWTVVKEPTCTEDGLKEATCEDCGAKTEEIIPKLNHKYKDSIDPATGMPIKICERCDDEKDVPSAPATPQNPVEEILQMEKKNAGVENAPSSPETGSGSDTPSSENGGEENQNNEDQNDNQEQKKEQPKKKNSCANGHDYKESSVTDATCLAAGKKTEKCSRCGNTRETEIAATGHSYTSSKTDATCTAAGKTTEKCSKCGDTKETEIPATGHSYTPSETAATCTAAGKKTEKCSRCGDTKETEIPATGHSYAVTGNVDATCTVAGKKTETCSKCGDVKETEVAALGHNMAVSPDAESDGRYTHTYKCSREGCGYTEGTPQGCDLGDKESAGEAGHRITCRTCGRNEIVSHKLEIQPADDGKHYTSCLDCDYMGEPHAFVDNGAMDESGKPLCDTCGFAAVY